MSIELQEAPQMFRNRMFRQESARPKQVRILVLKTGVAGMYFQVDDDEQDAVNALKPGDEVLLYREPDNKHDPWAISVYLPDQRKIGFLTRYKNETIARLMDVGKRFVAEVLDKDDDEIKALLDWENDKYRAAPSEKFDVPIAIYMIEEG